MQVRTQKSLGILGTINYVGAILVITYSTQIDYSRELFKGIAFLVSGMSLLFFSGWIYYLSSKEKTSIIHGSLNSLTQVFQRIPEQVDKTKDNASIVTLMKTIEKYPDKIIDLIKDINTKT